MIEWYKIKINFVRFKTIRTFCWTGCQMTTKELAWTAVERLKGKDGTVGEQMVGQWN